MHNFVKIWKAITLYNLNGWDNCMVHALYFNKAVLKEHGLLACQMLKIGY